MGTTYFPCSWLELDFGSGIPDSSVEENMLMKTAAVKRFDICSDPDVLILISGVWSAAVQSDIWRLLPHHTYRSDYISVIKASLKYPTQASLPHIYDLIWSHLLFTANICNNHPLFCPLKGPTDKFFISGGFGSGIKKKSGTVEGGFWSGRSVEIFNQLFPCTLSTLLCFLVLYLRSGISGNYGYYLYLEVLSQMSMECYTWNTHWGQGTPKIFGYTQHFGLPDTR